MKSTLNSSKLFDRTNKTLLFSLSFMETNGFSVGKGSIWSGGGVAEWFRALDLKSGGPWFKSFTLLLSGFVLGSPEFNSSTALCK